MLIHNLMIYFVQFITIITIGQTTLFNNSIFGPNKGMGVQCYLASFHLNTLAADDEDVYHDRENLPLPIEM